MPCCYPQPGEDGPRLVLGQPAQINCQKLNYWWEGEDSVVKETMTLKHSKAQVFSKDIYV